MSVENSETHVSKIWAHLSFEAILPEVEAVLEPRTDVQRFEDCEWEQRMRAQDIADLIAKEAAKRWVLLTLEIAQEESEIAERQERLDTKKQDLNTLKKEIFKRRERRFSLSRFETDDEFKAWLETPEAPSSFVLWLEPNEANIYTLTPWVKRNRASIASEHGDGTARMFARTATIVGNLLYGPWIGESAIRAKQPERDDSMRLTVKNPKLFFERVFKLEEFGPGAAQALVYIAQMQGEERQPPPVIE